MVKRGVLLRTAKLATATEEDIERLLAESGFELLAKYGDDTFDPPAEDSQRIVYAARCVRNGQRY